MTSEEESRPKKAKLVPAPARFCAVYCGSSDGDDPAYRAAAHKLGQLLAAADVGLIYGGASCGLMGAVADGVLESRHGYAVGVFPEGSVLPQEIRHQGLSEIIKTPTMRERKEVMCDKANILVALPGGLGTLDELCEVIDLKKIGQHNKPIFALNTHGFWDPLSRMFHKMEESGFLKPGVRGKLVEFVGCPEEIVTRAFPAEPEQGSNRALPSIDKLALILVHNRKQLVARTRGKTSFFTPGGKRELGKTDEQALLREIREELSVDLVSASIKPYGVFEAQASGKPSGTMVRMTCFEADYTGTLTPANEIEELKWISSGDKALLSATGVMIVDDLQAKGLID